MANVLDELIKEIPEPRIREGITHEVATLLKEKKFGPVFREHIPEIAVLYEQPIKPGLRAIKRREGASKIYRVLAVKGSQADIVLDPDTTIETILTKELVPVKRFGEPI